MKSTQTVRTRVAAPDAQTIEAMTLAENWTRNREATRNPIAERSAQYLLALGEFVEARLSEIALTNPLHREEILKSEAFQRIANHPDPTLSELAELSVRLGADVFCTPLTAPAAPHLQTTGGAGEIAPETGTD